MSQANRYQGGCFCGEVQFELTGDPVAMGYCHCESCRHWSAGPVNAFSLWAPDALRLTRGAERLESFNKTPRSTRKWCATCGGHLFTEHPEWNLVDVYAAVISDFDFQPAVHVNYQETVLPMADGLPKFKDVPADMGGSGITLEE
ncbi:GFA family protein [Salinisphaera sp. SPP-AMP-43]|uniref:GFA family protein n=1 Tax=Salinisphaera sp. SPP-AMP-43 TaxID=3121288 RepID=UPI003C6E5686